MYFPVDVSPDEGFRLLVHDSDVIELVRSVALTGICRIHVFRSWSTADSPPEAVHLEPV